MRSIKFILIDTGSESNKIMMSDVGKLGNGIQRSKTYETGNRFLDTLIRLHFSYEITKRINLPGKSIWNKYCVLDKLTSDDNTDYCIIIVNNAIHRLSVKHLNEMQNKDNIHIFSLLLDPFDRLPKNVQAQLKSVNWEKVFSFQRSDCEKYGFEFTDKIYSKVNIDDYSVESDPKSDVYFVGLAKDRMDMIYEIYRKLTGAGCICDFTVIIGKNELDEYKKKYPGISFKTSRIPYSDVLRRLSASRCILELCAKGQDGLTMRFYEAVFYNKLLITNNQTALTSELYDARYMQVINDCKDIDIKKVRELTPVNYGYDGSYSPIYFTKQVLSGMIENEYNN